MALGGIVRGKKSTLRAPIEADLPVFARWMADMRVRRMGRIWHEPAMPATWKERLTEQAKSERSVMWTAEQDGAAVGLVRIDLHVGVEHPAGASVEQLIVDPDRWRSGIGWDMALALHRYLFDYLDLERVGVALHADNAAALRIAQRLGYAEFAHGHDVYYRDGAYVDELAMFVERTTWHERFVGEREYEPMGRAG
jgi:RimJ/RimL family protein N-acetyltransferase